MGVCTRERKGVTAEVLMATDSHSLHQFTCSARTRMHLHQLQLSHRYRDNLGPNKQNRTEQRPGECAL